MSRTTNAKKRAARGFFTTSIANIRTLAERGATCAEIAAYLALAVSTDSSNEVSRAGNKSVATILGVSHKRAGLFLDALVAKGAVKKRSLSEVRDPTAARFDLVLSRFGAAPLIA